MRLVNHTMVKNTKTWISYGLLNQWFTWNKLSLNTKKTKYSFFYKPSKKDNIPFMLPKLTISNHVVERQEFIKFLGVLLDENLNWKEHIKYTENKIAKKLGLLYKAKPFWERNACLTSSLLLIYTNLYKLYQHSLGQYLQDKP